MNGLHTALARSTVCVSNYLLFLDRVHSRQKRCEFVELKIRQFRRSFDFCALVLLLSAIHEWCTSFSFHEGSAGFPPSGKLHTFKRVCFLFAMSKITVYV